MLVRFLLFAVVFYLLIKLVRDIMRGGKKEEKVKSSTDKRTVSKDVGEYVDYEEVKDKPKDFR